AEAAERGDAAAAGLETERARAALDDPARAAAERASELSARQNYLQGGAQRLEETLGRLADLLDEEEQERAWLDLAEQAESEMRGAAESLARARLAQAAASQRSSLGSLQRLKEALDARSAGQEAQERQGKEQEEERYRDLAERQRALEEETRTLMDRLKDLENTAQQEALQDAASRMNQAASELDKQEGTAALPREEEAEKYLAQAQEELKDEEERYQELRQEGLLFKVREELEALRAGALELNDKTAEIDLERAQKSELTRSGRARARGLAADARALATRNDEVIEKIREDGALVFTFTLERNSEDLARIGDLLGTRPHATDEFTRSIVQDVVERYDDLLATLKEELERRRSAERQESPPGEEQRPRQQPLIPRVAELLMVKRMEEAALRKVDVFLRTHPELEEEGLDDVSRDRLQRLGGQHSEITRLFESLVESVPEEAADGGEPGPKEKR
ncbi:MAG: hypothetical protein HY812_16640, partial [Planctomycetes bacterium]|nr:hypothetical protein [Planctomycetota bacterium]